jgi:lipid-A-disaccharide synthase
MHIPVVFNATYDLLANAEAAIVASGTATLETALLQRAAGSGLQRQCDYHRIAKMLVKIKFISLVNLIMDKLVVKELIQQDCDFHTVSNELDKLVGLDDYRQHHARQLRLCSTSGWARPARPPRPPRSS